MTKTDCRWVLAFDASCALCEEVSRRVERASAGRLEVLPLGHRDVRRWREQALGRATSWAPTLLKVEGTRVRAWTGVRMGSRLAVRLGPRRTVLVLRALGDPERDGPADGNQAEGTRIGRRGVFRLGAGAGVAAALLLNGKVPAFAAESRELAAGRSWARANQTPRVGQYDELTRISAAHRPAVFAALSPSVRSSLWVEQVKRYRRAHSLMSAEQARVLDEFEAIVADEATYTREDAAIQARMKAIEERGIAAFGRSEACGLMSTLGSLDTAETHATATNSVESAPAATCQCNVGSACSPGCNFYCACTTSWGCGCGWIWTCNGTYCA